ncbi:hypothetical protein [Sphingomonas bacterium]|uniref:hypothetical protein n=1 Tax=Sphingomonas bacterium TaxID=1895847 RepID=UPI00157542D4|nr:hypothetical protein [Sphingomonas bacterium]
MARRPTPTTGERLRAEGDKLYDLADRWDASERHLSLRQQLHHEVEQLANTVRAVVRGRGFG